MKTHRFDSIISRRPESDELGVWRFDPGSPGLLQEVQVVAGGSLDPSHKIIQIGKYLLEWGPAEGTGDDLAFPYRLMETDPANGTPLVDPPVQSGTWEKSKFWHGRVDFGNEGGDSKNFSSAKDLKLIPLGGNFILNFIPTPGRGTFQLWNFDPASDDPLPVDYTPQGAFETIQEGHQLLPIGGFVLDWVPATSEYSLWSFDPQSKMPLARPTVQAGRWSTIDAGHQLVPIGGYVLDWVPADLSYRLWEFDPKSPDPLTGPVQAGNLPDALSQSSELLGVQPPIPVRAEVKDRPGTIDFMRDRIKHVVYIMIENRAFDHVCGWLYEHDQPAQLIGPGGCFKGASTEMFNMDGDKKVFLSKYADGRMGDDVKLEILDEDPYHDNSDVMRQLFNGEKPGYEGRCVPNMGGFVWNNGTPQVMETYSPEQLPVLNGLARSFAVSDEWFCSMPGGTDVNRAFSLTGSSGCMLNNFQNGAEYENWPSRPHRPSIWKTLWSNGIRDWKIYNSVEWFDFVFTYHLFLQGQIPSVDSNQTQYLAGIEQFKKDARSGTLPAFSYLEPVWIAKKGTTSYHPGGDLVPGEVALNEIFSSLQDGPNSKWDETLLVVTFDEHGGIFDHVPPSYAENPYPNDIADGFKFDLMGVRVPTLLVSPWIGEKTVFRSETGVPYDATSFLATLLDWFGIPKWRWGLGQRTHHAPTFEGVLTEREARKDRPSFTPPHDSEFDGNGNPKAPVKLHDLHRVMLPRLVSHIAGKRLSPTEVQRAAERILSKADNLEELDGLLHEFSAQMSAAGAKGS